MRRLVKCAAATAATASILAVADPSAADRIGVAFTDSAGVGSAVATSGATAGSSASRGRSECSYAPLELPPGQVVYDVNGAPIATSSPGSWFTKACTGSLGEYSAEAVFVAELDPAELAAEAAKYLPLPAPAIAMNPGGDQVVNLESWLWVDAASWAPQSSTVSVPGVSVTATATPVRVVWEMGDGGRVVCAGPGVAYDAGRPAASQSTDCSYTYRRSSAHQPGLRYPVTATVEWQASWTASGVVGGGDLGVIRRSSSTAVRVIEIQAVNR